MVTFTPKLEAWSLWGSKTVPTQILGLTSGSDTYFFITSELFSQGALGPGRGRDDSKQQISEGSPRLASPDMKTPAGHSVPIGDKALVGALP